MNSRVSPADLRRPMKQGIAYSHFNVQAEPPQRRLLAWRDRVGHVIDVLPSRSDLERPFQASIDRYQVGDLVFTDCRSDLMVLERSLARISVDSVRDFVFHVFLEGGIANIALPRQREDKPAVARIVALDMGQPVRMQRNDCRVLTFFVPGELVQEVFPDPEAIHCRALSGAAPLAGMIVRHVAALAQNIGSMSAGEADSAIRAGAQLLVAGFGKDAGLSGNARAAARSVMFDEARRYIKSHLYEETLSPESVLGALPFPRRSLYRLFEHEGGLSAYIRHLRLRSAAEDLTRYPHATVTEIAYGVGFKSASDFTRAFRRAFDMAPQDFRALAAETA
ncbi:helix-turn-helix domain-containing protein [Paraburkholderia sp.]|uniref:helix-turn-helix domain-containing protein n=1 Tax=Paraburkholderia sp. TaxID=1926495 RepID=UPI0026097F14|nr:helix-turn-helix domain-containing protein [Paraburkholderia sp.]